MRPGLHLILLGVILGMGSAWSQDPSYVLSLTSATAPEGSSFDVLSILDNSSGEPLAGWSWGVCHDTDAFEILSISDGASIATINGGGPPDFNAPGVFPGAGWTMGVVINFFGDFVLPPGAGHELHVATYSALSVGTGEVAYCQTLGTPPVFISLATDAGVNISPVLVAGSIEVVESPNPFRLFAPSGALGYNVDDGTGSFTGSLDIEEDAASPTFPSATQGLSLGLANDPLLIPVGVAPAPALLALNGGAGPDFFGPSVTPVGGPGMTVGVVYNFLGGQVLPFPTRTPTILLSYQTDAPALIGNEDGTVAPIFFLDTLGSPEVINTIVVNGASLGVEFFDGEIELVPAIDPPFVRGDCNDDGATDIADGVWILNALFQDGPAGTCEVACDANDDGFNDQSDAVYILNYRFLGGAQPPAPFPGCGVEVQAACEEFTSCP